MSYNCGTTHWHANRIQSPSGTPAECAGRKGVCEAPHVTCWEARQQSDMNPSVKITGRIQPTFSQALLSGMPTQFAKGQQYWVSFSLRHLSAHVTLREATCRTLLTLTHYLPSHLTTKFG